MIWKYSFKKKGTKVLIPLPIVFKRFLKLTLKKRLDATDIQTKKASRLDLILSLYDKIFPLSALFI